jgi:hypothetical protein
MIGKYRQQFDAWENGETCDAPARQRGPDGRLENLHGAQGRLDAFRNAEVFRGGSKPYGTPAPLNRVRIFCLTHHP